MNKIIFNNIGLYSAKQRMTLSDPNDKGECSLIPARESLKGRILSFVGQFSLFRRVGCVHSYVLRKCQQDVLLLEKILFAARETYLNINESMAKQVTIEVKGGKPLTARVIRSLIGFREGSTDEFDKESLYFEDFDVDEYQSPGRNYRQVEKDFQLVLGTYDRRDSVGSDFGYVADTSNYVNAKSSEQSKGIYSPLGWGSEFGEDTYICQNMAPAPALCADRSSSVQTEESESKAKARGLIQPWEDILGERRPHDLSLRARSQARQ